MHAARHWPSGEHILNFVLYVASVSWSACNLTLVSFCNMNNGRPVQLHLSDISQINLLVVCLHVIFFCSSFIVVCHTHTTFSLFFSFVYSFNTVHLLLSAFENCHFHLFCNNHQHQFYWHYEARECARQDVF